MRLTCDPPRPTHFVLKFIVSALAIATAAAPKTSLAQQTLAPERDIALAFCSLSEQNSCESLDSFAKLLFPKIDNMFAQTPGIPDVQASPEGANFPSLQTEPSVPQEKPFVPQNLPLVPSETLLAPGRYGIAPNISVITPSAYGKSWGSISVGLGLQERTRFSHEADGVLGVGFGLGDAKKAVGLDIGVSIADLDTAKDGSISFKVHRQLPDDFAVAVGVLNAIDWGLTDSGTSVYGVVTKRFRLRDRVDRPFSQLYVSAGVGSGQFRSESNINEDVNSVGFFSSVAVRVAEPVNLIAEWSGQDLTIGLSVLPFRNIPLVVTPGVTDITGSAGDGSRFILGVGYLISF